MSSKRIGKHLLARKVRESIGRVVHIAPQIKYSPNHIALFAGERGKVISFDIGDGEAEDIIMHLEVVVMSGAKKPKETKHQVWVNALDITDLLG